VALVWANAAAGSYESVWQTELPVGPAWLHLDLTLSGWVTDGLLAVFFFVAGLEVKRELVVGELAGWRAAALPLAAALGGMLLPAGMALAASGGAAAEGGAWAIPVATDIAFALGVLALAGSALPAGVRVLLLSMAVIDDLGAITLIAVLFTHDLRLVWLGAAAALCALYGWAQHSRHAAVWLIVPIALAAWVCLHASGVHATVAGVALGLLTPVRPRPGESESLGERLERRLHPLSAGVVVPLFALAAAGISVASIPQAVADPIAHGVVAGLLIGKTVGILGGAWLAVRAGLGRLPDGVGWADLVPVAVLGGIGYTVSLLVTELAIADAATREHAATAVLAASLVAATVAVMLLRRRRHQIVA
jgi:NhaA family Na+:H+ antiporter